MTKSSWREVLIRNWVRQNELVVTGNCDIADRKKNKKKKRLKKTLKI